MKEIQRFEFAKDDVANCYCDIEVDPKGSLINYDDHLAALAEKDREIAHLAAEKNLLFDDGVEKGKQIATLKAEVERLKKALHNLVDALDAVHGDPEYQAVWTLYQLRVPTGYRGRKYTKEFNEAKEALKEAI